MAARSRRDTDIDSESPRYLLVSANYTFETESRAKELGFDTRWLTRSRSGGDHRLLELATTVRIPGEDWRIRQDELNRVLESVVQEARTRSISLPADGAYLSLRISFVADEGEQMGFTLASDFLRSWADLGGDLHLDS
jgi:hypothetical protein